MDNGENLENNEPDTCGTRRSSRSARRCAIEVEHEDDSDIDKDYNPTQEEIIENESESSSCTIMTDRTYRQCRRVRNKASQDAVYEVVRSQLSDDRNRMTDDTDDDIPLARLVAAHRVTSTPNRLAFNKKRK